VPEPKKGSRTVYPWVTHTWNTIKGKCPHGCSFLTATEINKLKQQFGIQGTNERITNLNDTCDFRTTVTIEPIMDFDPEKMEKYFH
jgi:hypothetical protein